mgnify:CR=1 FL=1
MADSAVPPAGGINTKTQGPSHAPAILDWVLGSVVLQQSAHLSRHQLLSPVPQLLRASARSAGRRRLGGRQRVQVERAGQLPLQSL